MLLFLFLNYWFTRFNSYIAELTIPLEIPNKEAEAEIEIHRIFVKPKVRKCSI